MHFGFGDELTMPNSTVSVDMTEYGSVLVSSQTSDSSSACRTANLRYSGRRSRTGGFRFAPRVDDSLPGREDAPGLCLR
jgi:hypothetical protein